MRFKKQLRRRNLPKTACGDFLLFVSGGSNVPTPEAASALQHSFFHFTNLRNDIVDTGDSSSKKRMRKFTFSSYFLRHIVGFIVSCFLSNFNVFCRQFSILFIILMHLFVCTTREASKMSESKRKSTEKDRKKYKRPLSFSYTT